VFSFLGRRSEHPAQLPCHITATNERTHEIIRKASDRSPMFTGRIEGVGPRYCPSIEDKVFRFASRTSHQIFVEPEGLTTRELYPNGISTSLPFDAQYELVRSIRGFENAHLTRPGYAIEYDFFDPRDLKMSLETKHLAHLYFAGQINGTTGYEEAAAQGLLAGTNAALRATEREPWCPQRGEAYLGVLIDDLVTRGAPEPYRMFTSRAEFRLQLREDNADLRLTEDGRRLGLVDDARWDAFNRKRDAVSRETQRLRQSWVHPRWLGAEPAGALLGKAIEREYPLIDLLRRPGVGWDQVAAADALVKQARGSERGEVETAVSRETLRAELGVALADAVIEQVEIGVKYAGYIDKQQEEVQRAAQYEQLPLPEDLDYSEITALSFEVRQKLARHRPATLGQASRISGITPAAISLLLVHLRKGSWKDFKAVATAGAGDDAAV
jgi:tRNA uridine 5-carboxymethylaminomethyl modification enzyme